MMQSIMQKVSNKTKVFGEQIFPPSEKLRHEYKKLSREDRSSRERIYVHIIKYTFSETIRRRRIFERTNSKLDKVYKRVQWPMKTRKNLPMNGSKLSAPCGLKVLSKLKKTKLSYSGDLNALSLHFSNFEESTL